MTQSTNARPCNCDQALAAEERAQTAESDLRAIRSELDQVSRTPVGRSTAPMVHFLVKAEALGLTCAAQGRKLAAIEKILLEHPEGKVNATLRGFSFTSPTLEAIRSTMLVRPW